MPIEAEIIPKGVERTKREFRDFFYLFKDGEADVKSLNKEMRQISGTVYGARRSLMLMRTEWRMNHAAWVEGSRVLRDVGRIGSKVTSIWQAYTIGLIRIETAQRNVEKSTKDVAELQEEYNRYVEVFGKDAAVTKAKLKELEDAEASAKDEADRLKKATDDASVGIVGMGLSAMGIVGDFAALAFHLHNVKEILVGAGGLKAALTTVATAFGALGTTGAAALIGIPALVVGVTLAFDQLIRATTAPEILEAYKTVKEAEGGVMPRGGVMAKGVKRILEREHPEVYERTYERPSGGARGFTRTLAPQFGLPYVPEPAWYYLERGEEVVSAPIVRMRGRGERGVTARTVNINIYVDKMSSDVDLERAVSRAYQKLLRKLKGK